MDAVGTLGIAEAGGAVLILCAVKHDYFAGAKNHSRIEGASRLPCGSLRRDDGNFGEASPCPERQVCAILRNQPQQERAQPYADFATNQIVHTVSPAVVDCMLDAV